jgi:hypothetical protein
LVLSWLRLHDFSQTVLPKRPCGLLAGGVGGMEPVMACLPSFLNLRGHLRLCTQRCTGSGDAAALRRHSLTHTGDGQLAPTAAGELAHIIRILQQKLPCK